MSSFDPTISNALDKYVPAKARVLDGGLRFASRLLVGSILGSIACVAAAPAMAQTASAEIPSSEPEPHSDQLQEIIVVAQKRAQNLQSVPLAVSAIGGAQLGAAGIVNTQDLKVAFPGVNIRTTSSNFQPSIRGIGTSSVNVENPVALYIDDVYYPSQRDAMRDLNDIEQVAVLKGPQGTLFGRNATGGVIQITTSRPSDQFEGHIAASIDNFATLRTDARISGPLSDTVSASLSGNYVEQGDGWGKNVVTGRDTFKINHIWSARGKILFEPTDATTFTLIGDYMDRSDNLGAYYRPYPGTSLGFPGYIPTSSVYDSDANYDSLNTFKGGGVSLSAGHEFGDVKLASITAFRKFKTGYRFDADMSPLTYFDVDSSNTHGQSFSEELQLTSVGNNNVNWALGVFYFQAKNSLEPIERIFGGPLVRPAPRDFVRQVIYGKETTESIAPFGQIDFTILPETRLTLGARWTYEKRKFDGSFAGFRSDGTYVPAIIPDISGAKAIAKKPTWRIALDHQFTPDVLGYVSYNRGFKSGGFNIANPANASYAPERLDAYEAGLKTELFDRKVRLNSSVFYYDYANIQVIQFLIGVNTIVNGAKAELYGLDVDVEAQVAKGLRLSGGFELLHTKFKSFPSSSVSSPLPQGGVSVVSGDVSGNRLPLAQKFTGTISLEYTTDTKFGEFGFNTTLNHNGSYYFESDNVTRQKSYQMLNASARLNPLENLVLSVFVKNALNEKIISLASAIPGIGYITSYDNPPRTYGVSARVNF